MEEKGLMRIFKADLKIAYMRAGHNEKNEEAAYYKEILDKLELIEKRRQLALLGEKNKEKEIYQKVSQMISAKYRNYEKSDYEEKDEIFKTTTEYIEYLLNKEYDVEVSTKKEEPQKVEMELGD